MVIIDAGSKLAAAVALERERRTENARRIAETNNILFKIDTDAASKKLYDAVINKLADDEQPKYVSVTYTALVNRVGFEEVLLETLKNHEYYTPGMRFEINKIDHRIELNITVWFDNV